MIDIVSINSIIYRGYFYDYETGLYYLQSRYYDPETGRFINADDTAYIGYDSSPLSTNIFAYCANNPVRNSDYNGKWYITYTNYIFVYDRNRKAFKNKYKRENYICFLAKVELIKAEIASQADLQNLLTVNRLEL